MRTRFDGLHTLSFQYDNAGRPIQVTEPATGLTWQEWVYGTANAGSNRQLGKLIEARRFNYPSPTAPWVVTKRYEYQGVAGALSKKITLLELPNNPFPDDFGESFEQSYTYDSLGRVTSQSYPACIPTPDRFHQHCQDGNETPATAFTTGVTYSHGLPTAVTGSFGLSASYQYHPNLTLSRIDHGNGIVTLFDEDPSHMPRPRRIQVQRFGSNAFDSGFYAFDEAGNVRSIGSDVYAYDQASRLLSGTVKKAGSTRVQSYSYDPFDNILSVATDGNAPEDYTVNANKNRLIDPEIAYDAAGNMVRFEYRIPGGVIFPTDSHVRHATYDALNMQSTLRRWDLLGTPVDDYLYIYGPGNVRLFVWDGIAAKRHFTFRDLNAKPLREMEVTGFGAGAVWTHQKDYLHGPSGLIATRAATGIIKYFHHDHLGTPRLLTSAAGSGIASFHYYPFGEAVGLTNPNDEPGYKFTGHERDRGKVTDYMLGRTYAYPFQRFMQVDPARDGWNLYGYVGGNPVNAVDPDGLADDVVIPSLAASPEMLRDRALMDDALIEFVKITHARDKHPFLTALSYGISFVGRGLLAMGAPASNDEIVMLSMAAGLGMRAPGVGPPAIPMAATRGGLRSNLLSRATATSEGAVSPITRAIQKHATREGSAFRSVSGNLAARNAAGRAVADEILGNAGTTFNQRTTGRFGQVLDVVAPDGRGLRFGSDGKFIGLLEPPR